MANPYFQYFATPHENQLLKSLTDEMIEIHGIPIIYLPQSSRKEDPIYGEDILAQYLSRYEMTMYLSNYEDWGSGTDFYNKFGMVVTDTAEFIIEKTKFTTYSGLLQPYIGDIIYLPWRKDQMMFMVTKAEDEHIFYPLGDQIVWQIKCKAYEYSHEDIRLTAEDPYSPNLDELIANDDFMNDIESVNEEFEEIKGEDTPNDTFDDLD